MTTDTAVQAEVDTNFIKLFEPESIAIVGASQSPMKWGFRFVALSGLQYTCRGRRLAIAKDDSLWADSLTIVVVAEFDSHDRLGRVHDQDMD